MEIDIRAVRQAISEVLMGIESKAVHPGITVLEKVIPQVTPNRGDILNGYVRERTVQTGRDEGDIEVYVDRQLMRNYNQAVFNGAIAAAAALKIRIAPANPSQDIKERPFYNVKLPGLDKKLAAAIRRNAPNSDARKKAIARLWTEIDRAVAPRENRLER